MPVNAWLIFPKIGLARVTQPILPARCCGSTYLVALYRSICVFVTSRCYPKWLNMPSCNAMRQSRHVLMPKIFVKSRRGHPKWRVPNAGTIGRNCFLTSLAQCGPSATTAELLVVNISSTSTPISRLKTDLHTASEPPFCGPDRTANISGGISPFS